MWEFSEGLEGNKHDRVDDEFLSACLWSNAGHRNQVFFAATCGTLSESPDHCRHFDVVIDSNIDIDFMRTVKSCVNASHVCTSLPLPLGDMGLLSA
jgi:hypothetical protein